MHNEEIGCQAEITGAAAPKKTARLQRAKVLTDQATKTRIWDVMDYDLAQFWPGGPTSPDYCAVRVQPVRVELSQMFGTMNKRVWKA